MWNIQFVEGCKEGRWVLARGDRLRRTAEQPEAFGERHYEPGLVFEAGTKDEANGVNARGRGERFECGDNGLGIEAPLHGAIDDAKICSRLARVEIAEGIDDERLKASAPGGLRKRPPGECSD